MSGHFPVGAAGVYQADDLNSADQVILMDGFKTPFLGEAETVVKLSLGLVMWSSAEVIPFGASCLVFNRTNIQNKYHLHDNFV